MTTPPLTVQQALTHLQPQLEEHKAKQAYLRAAPTKPYLGLMWTALSAAPPKNLTSSGFIAGIPLQIVTNIAIIATSLFRFLLGVAFWEKNDCDQSERVYVWLRDLGRVFIEPFVLVAQEVSMLIGLCFPVFGNILCGRIEAFNLYQKRSLARLCLEIFKNPDTESLPCLQAKKFIIDHYGAESFQKLKTAYSSGTQEPSELIAVLGTDQVAAQEAIKAAEKEVLSQSIRNLLEKATAGISLTEEPSKILRNALKAALAQKHLKAVPHIVKVLRERPHDSDDDKLFLLAYGLTDEASIRPLSGKILLSPDDVQAGCTEPFYSLGFGSIIDPVSEKPMGPLLLEALDRHLDRWLSSGLVELAKGDWTAPALRGNAMNIVQKYLAPAGRAQYAIRLISEGSLDDAAVQRLFPLLTKQELAQVQTSLNKRPATQRARQLLQEAYNDK